MFRDKLIQKLKEIVPEYEAFATATSPVNSKQEVEPNGNEPEITGPKLKQNVGIS